MLLALFCLALFVTFNEILSKILQIEFGSILLEFDQANVGLGMWNGVSTNVQKEQIFVLQENTARLILSGQFMSFSVYIAIINYFDSHLKFWNNQKYKNFKTVSNKEVVFVQMLSWDWDAAIKKW